MSGIVHHLEDCVYLPEACPLRCISLEGDKKGEVVRMERRHIPEHVTDFCPLREIVCEFCEGNVKASEMNPHLEDCEEFPLDCPNGCSIEGEDGVREVKRKDIPVHLDNHCPLQKVQCPYWDHGDILTHTRGNFFTSISNSLWQRQNGDELNQLNFYNTTWMLLMQN